jgi:hypothetical protein
MPSDQEQEKVVKELAVVVPDDERGETGITPALKHNVKAAIALAMEGLADTGVAGLVHLPSAPTASAEVLEEVGEKFENVGQNARALKAYSAALDAYAQAPFTNEAFRYSLIKRLRNMMRVGQSIKRLGGDIIPN